MGFNFLGARPCDLLSLRENRGEGQTDVVKRSLGGKGFGDSANAALFCPFSGHVVCIFAKRPVSRSLFVLQNDRHRASRFAFLLSAHPWALKLSALLPILPLPTVHFEGGLPGPGIPIS